MKRPKEKLRWSFDGLATLGDTIVGNVALGASGDWFAHGMLSGWEDTPLGSYQTVMEARYAVVRWVKENRDT